MRNCFVLGIVLLTLVFVAPSNSVAQSQCNCETAGVCSATQSCPAGYIAVCTCTSASCGSSCQKEGDDIPIENFSGGAAIKLGGLKASEIGGTLSKMLGRRIEFIPRNISYRLPSARSFRSHWTVLEALAKEGKLTIDGMPIDYWLATRDALLRGDEFAICTGGAPVSLVIRNLSFISGEKLSIVSGDRTQKITSIKGNGLQDLIAKISEIASVSIVQN